MIADYLTERVRVRDGNWRCGMELWARHLSANEQVRVDQWALAFSGSRAFKGRITRSEIFPRQKKFLFRLSPP